LNFSTVNIKKSTFRELGTILKRRASTVHRKAKMLGLSRHEFCGAGRLWTKKEIPALGFQASEFVNEKGQRIGENNIKLGFVRYVMTDEFGRGCGKRRTTDYDSSLVEDPIDIIKVIPVKAISADNVEERTITPIVTRETK
jgi:hypothetical protein